MSDTPPDNIVRLADLRITSRRRDRLGVPPQCEHRNLVIDAAEGTLECQDCGKSVNPFLVLVRLTENRAKLQDEVDRLKSRAGAMRRLLASYRPHLQAAKQVEQIWRGRRMRPCCPECGMGLRAEDFVHGAASSVGIEYDDARRNRKAKPSAS